LDGIYRILLDMAADRYRICTYRMMKTMDAYHGTTRSRARKIFDQGLLPLPPSRRVWFATSRAYAMGRAKAQARRTRDEPRVFACELDLDAIRRQIGRKRVARMKGTVAIDGPVPIEMMKSLTLADLATVPGEVAAWANGLLALPEEDAVPQDHPGVIRLSRWINGHLASDGRARLVSSELLDRARRWLPEYFRRARLGPRRLSSHQRIGLTRYDVDAPRRRPDPREAEAFQCLEDTRPEERARGLSLLADINEPDLFEWCAMHIDDGHAVVRVAALHAMRRCADIIPDVVEPLVDAEERDIRAGAIAVMLKHTGDDARDWIRRGLADPEVCVRVEAARALNRLHPRKDREILVLASHDPNSAIAGKARKHLLKGKHRPVRSQDLSARIIS